MHTFNAPKTFPYILPSEAVVSNQSSVLVKVVSCTYSPAAEVDRSAPTKTLSTRIVDSLASELVLWRSLIAPVVRRSRTKGEVEALRAG